LFIKTIKLNLQNDHYAHKTKEIMSFKKDDYEILLSLHNHVPLGMRFIDLKQTPKKWGKSFDEDVDHKFMCKLLLISLL